MTANTFEHADEVRSALRAIVSDQAHGPDALSSPRVMASLLSDLLPEAPRESGLLAAAVHHDVAGMLREHVSNGLDAGVAVSLAASSFATSTAFTPEACDWITAEIAFALGLSEPGRPARSGTRGPATEIASWAIQLPDQERPASAVTDAAQPGSQVLRGPEPSPPAWAPAPPREPGWMLAAPLPGPYGTRDCPRCGRMQPRAARGKAHTAPGRLWCPGVPGIEYVSRDGYILPVSNANSVTPGQAAEERVEEQPPTPIVRQSSAAGRLAEVARLHAAGLLTDQEFHDKRQEIIRQL